MLGACGLRGWPPAIQVPVAHSRTSGVCPGHSRRARHSCIEGTSVTHDSPDHTVHVLSHRRSRGEPGRSHHQGPSGHPVCKDTFIPALIQCGPRYTPGSLDNPRVTTPYYRHSLSVGRATRLTPLVSGSPCFLSSSQTRTPSVGKRPQRLR